MRGAGHTVQTGRWEMDRKLQPKIWR